MITRAEFRTSLRSVLVDAIQFRDSQVNQWIDDAIRDYSIWLPFKDVAGITCMAGLRFYSLNDLTDDLLVDVIQVEYPTGETPRRFLRRLSERRYSFLGGPYYDINKQDYAVAGEHQELKFLVLGERPSGGESIWLEYTRPHTIPTTDSSNLTVPDMHLEVLRMYVIWRAALALEIDETISLVRKGDLIQTLGGSTARLERSYRQRIQAIAGAGDGERPAPWRMDEHDRIY